MTQSHLGGVKTIWSTKIRGLGFLKIMAIGYSIVEWGGDSYSVLTEAKNLDWHIGNDAANKVSFDLC